MYNISMPKSQKQIKLDIDLLRPQSQPQKILLKLIHWVLSAGRYLIVFVEILVLAAFVSRFKLDNDISETQEEIDLKVPFIQSLKDEEEKIRNFRFQISSLKDLKPKRPDFIELINKVAAQTPSGVTLSNMSFTSASGKINLKITGVAQNNDQLASLVYGLKSEKLFSGVNLGSVSLDQNLINFSIDCEIAGKGAKI